MTQINLTEQELQIIFDPKIINETIFNPKILHLKGIRGITFCRLASVDVICWPKGSFPVKKGTCIECWHKHEVLALVFHEVKI